MAKSVLTPKQQMILRMAEEKGFVTLGEASLVYSSPAARTNALKLLVALGCLRRTHKPNRFDFVRGVRL